MPMVCQLKDDESKPRKVLGNVCISSNISKPFSVPVFVVFDITIQRGFSLKPYSAMITEGDGQLTTRVDSLSVQGVLLCNSFIQSF